MSNHWGNTYTGELLLTQDIMDTGCILQIRNALPIIEENIKKIRKICMKLAREYKDTLQSGRTYGQHAVPITFGYKVAIWAEEINRHLKRLEQRKPRLFILEFAGVAGTCSKIANAMLENLLGEHERDWRTWGSEMKIIEESFLIISALLEIMVIELNRLIINEKYAS